MVEPFMMTAIDWVRDRQVAKSQKFVLGRQLSEREK